MFNISDKARLEFILEMVEDIELAIEEQGSIYKCLDNRIYKNSTLLNLLQNILQTNQGEKI